MQQKHITYLTLLLLFLVTIIGLPLDLLEPDASLYAQISKTIHLNGDYINLYSLGTDWLDKPHLPFWLTALSFKIFGVSNFSYKLPGVLVFFFGVWITYKFAKENYNEKTAVLAAIILATSQHSVISNFDVRAEPYLTGFIIAAMYWIYKYIKNKQFKDLIIACFFTGLAIMTKGMFAIIPLIAAIGGEFIAKRKWKEILNPMWIVAILLILVFILPELYALYLQFDSQPEKVIFGKTNVSGLKFFFWDSQFGRFFNSGPIKGSGDPFFFFHTIIWAFLPWSILFYIASFFKIKRNIIKVQHKEEFYTIFGAFATLAVFSLSKFQLPHYSNIVFPFMAIITADFIYKLANTYQKLGKTYRVIKYILCVIIILLSVLIFVFVKPALNYVFIAVLVFSIYLLFKIHKHFSEKNMKVFFTTCIVFILVNGFLFTHFYPTVLNYIGGKSAAKDINKNHTETIYVIGNKHVFGLEFYLDKPIQRISITELKSKTGSILYTNAEEIKLINKLGVSYKIVNQFDNYRISRLNGKFMNKKTREKTLHQVYLIKITS